MLHKPRRPAPDEPQSPGSDFCSFWPARPLPAVAQQRTRQSAAFCETDSPLQQSVQKTQLSRDVVETEVLQSIVLQPEPVICLPMHPLGFTASRVSDARRPTEPPADLVGLGHCAVPHARALSGVCQVAALAAGKVPAGCVDHCDPITAPWAREPRSSASVRTRGGLHLNPLFDDFAGALLAI